MKLWLAIYHDDDSASGTVQLWATSERKARRALADVAADAPVNYAVFRVQSVQVPNTREEMVRFLNRWADSGG